MSVAPDELTGTEQAVLLVLMAECRPVRNAELKTLGPELKKDQRNRLARHRLIDVSDTRPMTLELTDDGWALCRSLIGTDAPRGAVGQNRALYTVLRSLRRYLHREDLSPADVFTAADGAAAPALGDEGEPASDDGLEDRVRSAYRRLADRPGGLVGLRRVREAVSDVPRQHVDDLLVRLYQLPGVTLLPEENQKTLTRDDDDAAVRIGGQKKHLIAIEA